MRFKTLKNGTFWNRTLYGSGHLSLRMILSLLYWKWQEVFIKYFWLHICPQFFMNILNQAVNWLYETESKYDLIITLAWRFLHLSIHLSLHHCQVHPISNQLKFGFCTDYHFKCCFEGVYICTIIHNLQLEHFTF